MSRSFPRIEMTASMTAWRSDYIATICLDIQALGDWSRLDSLAGKIKI
jgi:hypothetical protein